LAFSLSSEAIRRIYVIVDMHLILASEGGEKLSAEMALILAILSAGEPWFDIWQPHVIPRRSKWWVRGARWFQKVAQ
jgi:hypothetical protein